MPRRRVTDEFLRSVGSGLRFECLLRLGPYFDTDEHTDDLRLVAAALDRLARAGVVSDHFLWNTDAEEWVELLESQTGWELSESAKDALIGPSRERDLRTNGWLSNGLDGLVRALAMPWALLGFALLSCLWIYFGRRLGVIKRWHERAQRLGISVPSNSCMRAVLAANAIVLGAMLSCVRFSEGPTVWPCTALGLAFVALGVRWLTRGRGLASSPLRLAFGRAAQLCFLLAAAADIVGILGEAWSLGFRLVPALTLCGWVSVLLLIGERWRDARGHCHLARLTPGSRAAMLLLPLSMVLAAATNLPVLGELLNSRTAHFSSSTSASLGLAHPVGLCFLCMCFASPAIFILKHGTRSRSWQDVVRGNDGLHHDGAAMLFCMLGCVFFSEPHLGFLIGWSALVWLYWGLVMTEPDEVAPETSRQVSEVPLGPAGA